MVTLRNSNMNDLNYVLEAESQASRTAFVNKWTKDQHMKAQVSEYVDHMIIEADHEPVGYLIMNRYEDNYELMRIVITKSGHGYGRQAITRLIHLAFDCFNINRFWLDVRSHNHLAIKLYKSLGFVEECVLREAVKIDSGYVSVIVMSILRREHELQNLR